MVTTHNFREISRVVVPLPSREVILERSASFRPVFMPIVTDESQESAAWIIYPDG